MALDQRILGIIQKITIDDVKEGSKTFVENERRGYIYPDALNEVQSNFGRPDKICGGISNLLRGWHNSFYRFGAFDEGEISKSVGHYHKELEGLRAKNIRGVSLDAGFETQFGPIFGSFLNATAGRNSKFTRRTVTGTSKSLSLLAPNLFPMCDEGISQAYDCWWIYSDFGFIEYMKFMRYMKVLAEQLVSEYARRHQIKDLNEAEALLTGEIKEYSGDRYQYDKSLLKTIDEYNMQIKYGMPKQGRRWC